MTNVQLLIMSTEFDIKFKTERITANIKQLIDDMGFTLKKLENGHGVNSCGEVGTVGRSTDQACAELEMQRDFLSKLKAIEKDTP